MLKVKDRRGTLSVKYDSLLEHFGVDNVTPLWVADMDFESPLCVREALEKIVEHAVAAVVHPFPDDRYRNRAGDDRQIEDAAER